MSTRKTLKGNKTSRQEDISQPLQTEKESTSLITKPAGVISTSPNRENRMSVLIEPLTSSNRSRKRTWESWSTTNAQFDDNNTSEKSTEPGSSSYLTFKSSCPIRSRSRPFTKSRLAEGKKSPIAATTGLRQTVNQLDISAETLNFDPVGCPASKEKTSRISSSSSHLTSDSTDEDNTNESISKQSTNLQIRNPSSIIAKNRPDMTTIVIPDELKETPGTSTKSRHLFSQSKKEVNLTKTVEFFQGRSFYGDTELGRIVGDLQEQMATKGLCVFDHFLGEEKGKMVLGDVLKLYEKGNFIKGQLEPSPNSSTSSSSSSQGVVRGDVITWLGGNENGCSNIKYLMERIDAAVMMCGKPFGGYTIKQRTRAMVACYPGHGTHYLKHIDNPCRNGRVLTCIYYLNVDWDSRRNGGLLRIYPEGSHEVANIEPIFDRLIFFWSDSRNPHEVKPAHRPRFAITLWYYDEKEQTEWLKRRGSEVPSLQIP